MVSSIEGGSAHWFLLSRAESLPPRPCLPFDQDLDTVYTLKKIESQFVNLNRERGPHEKLWALSTYHSMFWTVEEHVGTRDWVCHPIGTLMGEKIVRSSRSPHPPLLLR